MKIPWLGSEIAFPPVETALGAPNGLVAAGGDLSPSRLICAYRQGIFPWFSQGQPILWWCPDPRMVLFPQEIRISRSLQKRLRNTRYAVRFDHDFPAVISACAEPRPGQPGTWITSSMQQAYIELHRLGHAHSVETWIDGRLAGGLYGMSLGRVFFGESMFSRASDASKIALVALTRHLIAKGHDLIDCQMHTDHLQSMGARQIPRRDFSWRLGELINFSTPSGTWGDASFEHEPEIPR